MMAVPLTLRASNALIAKLHRHHKPVRGYRFAIGALCGDAIVGAVVVGRPVSRGVDAACVAEVTRLVTDGTRNACSFLYARAARAAAAMGYAKIQTYILASEPGTSLRAAGWQMEAVVRGRQWEHSTERQLRFGGHTRRTDQPTTDKQRWAKVLA